MKIKFVNDRIHGRLYVRLDDKLYRFCESYDLELTRTKCGSQVFYALPEGEVEIPKPFGDYTEAFQTIVELSEESGCRVVTKSVDGNVEIEILVG
ncbi:hypothetical protein CPT_Muldoon_222 [Serratia phage Muldoon]|uniref:Uncharacterized protein n=1 Tax=Serratia phage Muldoon TaxID=2601678 RepID=A0A5P8PHK2_9CAUD|nr:hypothetical protein HYP94_gp168 [Serratia phage Muldoon]QFR56173.1 hypothetical protein CPT_Muldoon_222 [Serratia phage Muldoon]